MVGHCNPADVVLSHKLKLSASKRNCKIAYTRHCSIPPLRQSKSSVHLLNPVLGRRNGHMQIARLHRNNGIYVLMSPHPAFSLTRVFLTPCELIQRRSCHRNKVKEVLDYSALGSLQRSFKEAHTQLLFRMACQIITILCHLRKYVPHEGCELHWVL